MSDDIIYGVNSITEALRGNRKVFELFLAEGADRRLEPLAQLAGEKGVPVRRRDRGSLMRLSGSEHHQGRCSAWSPIPMPNSPTLWMSGRGAAKRD